ncbi:MAG: TonB-dependent receptor domain-containing protein [Pseudohongiellaceae bacterium]
MKSTFLRLTLTAMTVLGLGAGYISGAAAAESDEALEEIRVTGTFIRGTPIDAESPVTVLERDELVRQGSPSIVEIVRRLSASSGVDGETNQFQSNASEGVSSINLRGLGAQRTLVLLNGKRQVPVAQRLPGGRFVDVNSFPRLAIRRVEVLKEGAAATYGSDAIGGVVNFITRDNFVGVELNAGHQNVEGSDGNQELGAMVGYDFGSVHWVASYGYEHRSELSSRTREFITSQTFFTNPEAGFSSIGNPGVLFNPAVLGNLPPALAPFGNFGALHPLAGGVPDPNCNLLGGTAQSLFCRFRYLDFDNLIEDEDRHQFFTEANGEIENTPMGPVEFHLEGLWAKVSVPEWKTSPSYPPQALFGYVQWVPHNHPGLVDMAAHADYGTQYQNYINPTTGGGVFYGRIAGVGAPAGRATGRDYDTFRLAASLEGTIESVDTGWELGVSWSRSDVELGWVDARIGRTALAFRGYGGSGCDARISIDANGSVERDSTGNLVINANGEMPGQGNCLWYNPFSNAIQTSRAQAAFGVVNPDYNAAVANSAEVLRYLDDENFMTSQADLLVVDLSFQGNFGNSNLVNEAAWALGYQHRLWEVSTTLDDLTNLNINPCQYEGETRCASETGLRSFLAGARPVDEEQKVHALFAEVAIDVNERLDFQLGLRYEDYGMTDTLDPKLAGRFVIADWLTFRASVQTTFRGPDIDALAGSPVTELQYVDPTTAFKAIDIGGVLSGETVIAVEPEEAFTYNLGFIFEPMEELTFTVDYWSYDFDNPIVNEDRVALVDAYAAGGERKTAVQEQIYCTSSAGLVNDGSCAASGIERVRVRTMNGPSRQISGVDVYATYDLETVSGVLTLGLDASRMLEYRQDAYTKNGVQIADSFDAAGRLNAGVGNLRPLPDMKGRVFAEYAFGTGQLGHNLLLYANYIGTYDDTRVSSITDPVVSANGEQALADSRIIDSQITLDLHYQLVLLGDTTRVTLSAINFLDEDPPGARLDLGYDAYTHSAFGRMIKLGVEYRLNTL